MSLMMTVRIALRAVAANKVRSGLTMLGIIIGVGAVVAMISIGAGASQSVTNQIQGLGSNLLTVMPGAAGSQGGVRQALGSATSLTTKDAEAIKTRVLNVVRISSEDSGRAQVIYQNNNISGSINGVTADYQKVRNTSLAVGRFIDASDLRISNRVAVVGQNIVTDLFSGADPVGKSIKVNNIPFNVVGVLASKGGAGFNSPDDTIFIPLTTAQNRVFGVDSLSQLGVQIKDPQSMDQAVQDIGWLLLSNHGLSDPQKADFRIMNQQDILQTMSQVTGTMTVLLGGIAGISLIVGGIGIMNIMLVSVTERTREIGLRKAVGAKRKDILKQFLTESVTLSLMGGLVGILIGVGGSRLISLATGTATFVTLGSVLLAFGFSSAIGIFFGIYPAMRASALSPIEALKYE
ncbi:MAG: ABC transporter permease [Actinomycetota bacterium]|nr:ABC transporter permease [Actinomycetota bacterium]